MTVYVNGRELEEHGLLGMSEARRRAGLYPQGLLGLLEWDVRELHAEGGRDVAEEVMALNRALHESGINLEPPADLAREGERQSRWESFLRRFQTRFIRAVCEGYVQQQQLFNSYLSRGLTLCIMQLYGGEEEPLQRERELAQRTCYRAEWDPATLEEVARECGGTSCLVLGIPGVELLERLRENARLVLAVHPGDDTVSRAQARMLPAWCGVRIRRLLEISEPDVDMLALLVPEVFPATELQELVRWAAENLPPEGRILAAHGGRFAGGIADREGVLRPHHPAFLASLLEGQGFRVRELRLGRRVFLEGTREGGESRGREGTYRPSAEAEGG